ncbi:ExeA family protein [Desulfobacula phenolica]|uniref:Type II secretory pathway, component ExeA (Predicted ATPase) n=1 Tax=Desulfobacula phenolica TaxID=90732 RepID=A0A1H2IZ00_9BACT|nr:AAA family ATPase [Desulfobacula phenolica]SDU49359.1 Type II secretory pathway, component ExeA (predicted ATPase) [Desulfobacula phenolica]
MDYKKLYGLKEAPFRLSPDPDFFFPSETHKNALETLVYAIRGGEGFVQITGQPGMGKSMLLRKILKDIGNSVVVGLILHSNIKADDLLFILMQDLKIDMSHIKNTSRESLIALFRDFLLARAQEEKQVIIIVDEAQNLPDETLEELRMLSNLETEKAKLLQIILVGQLELEEKITATRLSQLAQRITIRYRLKPFTKEETRAYIFHRLEIAAINPEEIPVSFQSRVIARIHKYSKGIPRLINIVCERCLMAAYVQGTSRVSSTHLEKAILSIDGEPDESKKRPLFRPMTYAVFAVFLLAACAGGYLRVHPDLPFFSRACTLIRAPFAASSPVSPALKGDPLDSESVHTIDSSQTATAPIIKAPATKAPITKAPITDTVKHPPRTIADTGTTPAEQTLTNNQQVSAASETILQTEKIKTEEISTQNTIPKKKDAIYPIQPNAADPFSIAKKWVTIPRGMEQIGVINMATHTLMMMKNRENRLVESSRINVDWPYPQGVYMAGYANRETPFIFHPEIAYLKKIQVDNPAFWQLIRTNSKSGITPIIAVNPETLPQKGPEQGAKTVRQTVLEWAATWQSMDLDKIMTYLGNVISIHDVENDQPLVFSKTRMRKIKENIFQGSGFIRLKLSDPVCLINPLDPYEAYAVFYQDYRSKIYGDKGTKVLYLRKFSPHADTPEWKIVGKLWALETVSRTAVVLPPEHVENR